MMDSGVVMGAAWPAPKRQSADSQSADQWLGRQSADQWLGRPEAMADQWVGRPEAMSIALVTPQRALRARWRIVDIFFRGICCFGTISGIPWDFLKWEASCQPTTNIKNPRDFWKWETTFFGAQGWPEVPGWPEACLRPPISKKQQGIFILVAGLQEASHFEKSQGISKNARQQQHMQNKYVNSFIFSGAFGEP